MPGWHAAAKKWVEQERLSIIGVIQEQHPERCRLFAQWKDFDWPIVHDPFNLLGNSAVPIAVAIDEHGIVRSTRPKQRTFEKDFLDLEFDTSPKPEKKTPTLGVTQDWKSLSAKIAQLPKTKQPGVDSLKEAADSILLWSDRSHLDRAIKFYQQAHQLAPKDSSLLFRLGVAFQMRHESDYRRKNDFGAAIDSWSKALAATPSQYIWRRRIQQYGPRLDKPYPFYDWVTQARNEIRKRGDKPVRLPVEPVGAELADRSKTFKESASVVNPDPDNKISPDTLGLINIENVVVPHTSRPDEVAMVHVLLSPKREVTWSNEAGPLVVWIEGKDIRQSQKLFRVTNRKKLESNENRKIEFEISRDSKANLLKGYALYYVCELSGQCRYLRQEFAIKLNLEPAGK